jgi:hypothetical protein
MLVRGKLKMLDKKEENTMLAIINTLFYFIVILYISSCGGTSFEEKGLKFDELDQASEIIINSTVKHTSPLVLTSTEKIVFAREFIKNHPKGWNKQTKWNPAPIHTISITFFDKAGEYLGSFEIGPEVLMYNMSYWKLVDSRELEVLTKTLGISKEMIKP